MKHLIIRNKGVILEEELYTLGLTNKDGKTTIGQFGTGLKYAIPCLLRFGIRFQVYSGGKQYVITKTAKNYRGAIVNYVTINGKVKDITTKFGKDYEVWQAIREIVSNAIDNGSFTISLDVNDPKINPLGDETVFVLEYNPQLEKVANHFEYYFRLVKYEEPFVSLSYNMTKIAVYLNKTEKPFSIYKKGILVYQSNNPSLFFYDIEDVEINELRSIQNSYYTMYQIAAAIARSNDQKFINYFLENVRDSHEESKLDFNANDLSNSWLDLSQVNNVVSEEVLDLIVEGTTEESKEATKELYKTIPNKIFKKIAEKKQHTPHYEGSGGYAGYGYSRYGTYVGETFSYPFMDKKLINAIHRRAVDFTKKTGLSFKAKIVPAKFSDNKGEIVQIKWDEKIFVNADLIKYPFDKEAKTFLNHLFITASAASYFKKTINSIDVKEVVQYLDLMVLKLPANSPKKRRKMKT